jgi:hypothetical protein
MQAALPTGLIAPGNQDIVALAIANFTSLAGQTFVLTAVIPAYPGFGSVEIARDAWELFRSTVPMVTIALLHGTSQGVMMLG